MVWIFSPPGVSSAAANRLRASDRSWRSKLAGARERRRPRASRRSASLATDQPPSRSYSRRCISEAAALV